MGGFFVDKNQHSRLGAEKRLSHIRHSMKDELAPPSQQERKSQVYDMGI